MKRPQLYLLLLIITVAGVLAIYQRTTDTDKVTLESEESEQEAPRLLKLVGDTLEVYEPLVSSEPIASITEPIYKNDDAPTYTLVGDKVFYNITTEQMVAWTGLDGVEHRLGYTLTNNGNASIDGFVVSRDASKIAWSTSQLFEGMSGFTIESTLWTADLEEGVATNVHFVSFENREAYLLPVRWSEDGSTLFFSEQRSGLGGYILFGAWHDLYKINLETQEVTQLAQDVNDIAPDEVMLSKVSMDETGTDVIALVNDDIDYLFRLPEGFSRAGNVLFSPDGKRVAYNIAAGNPDDEKYRVMITDLDTLEESIIVDSNSFYPNVVRWLNNETLLLQDNMGYYIANIDGTWNAF